MPNLHISLNGREVRLVAASATGFLQYTKGGRGKVGQGGASVLYDLSGVYPFDLKPCSFLYHQWVFDDHTASCVPTTQLVIPVFKWE